MDFRNLGDEKINTLNVAAKCIDHNYTNHECFNNSQSRTTCLKATRCNANKNIYTSNLIGNKLKKSMPISVTFSSNSVHLTRESVHKNIYTTDTYKTCDGPQENLPIVSSQIQEIQSSLEAYYLPQSVENLSTPSFPEIYSDHFNSDNQIQPNETTQIVNNKKQYAEKTTYCRPVLNLYDHEFIFKTLEKNAKLQRIVKRLVQTTQTERRRDDWNNYINDLKSKHRYDDNNNQTPQYPAEPVASHIIDDYNTKFGWQQSNSCKNILQDFYGTHNNIDNYAKNESNDVEDIQFKPNINPYIFGNNSYCYPTASQGRLHMGNKGKTGSKYADWHNKLPIRYNRGNTIVIDRDYHKTSDMRFYSPGKYTVNKAIDAHFTSGLVNKSISIQNDLNLHQEIKTKESFKDKFSAVTKNIQRLKKNISQSEEKSKGDSLISIENKLNHLITIINTVLLEIKTNKSQLGTNFGVNCKFSDERKLNTIKSETFGLISRLESCTFAQNVTKSTIDFADVESSRKCYDPNMFRINEILNEEIEKSTKIKQDIERILSQKSENPVQFTFDIPTKERSTEVTASLSKAKINLEKRVIIEEIDPPRNVEERQMTIAVNTEPLGLLALLRISTETVKQVLCCMPNFDYYSYLSMLQPQSKSTVSHYICNICGAAFNRPSQLSDHIQEHKLGKTRDCCVCRHVLDSHRQAQDLFACKYCGQRFTRAYCCELHQQTCAKTIGARHEVNPDLVLLT